jgi:cell division protein FtsB
MKNWRTIGLFALLAAGFLFLQYRLWFEPGGVRDFLQLKQTLAKQTQVNERLKKGNDELLFQVQRLQHSNDSIESRARNELGMIKKDETFYQVVKRSP